MDRDANDPFELMDEIESVLGIATCPMNWPIGSGKEFRGVYDRRAKDVYKRQELIWTLIIYIDNLYKLSYNRAIKTFVLIQVIMKDF